jgi:hypothetical protein
MIKEASQRGKQSSPKKESSSSQPGEDGGEDKMFKAYQLYKKKHGIRTDSFHKFMEFYQDYVDGRKQTRKDRQEEPQSSRFEQEED